jgi:hypothetical protein
VNEVQQNVVNILEDLLGIKPIVLRIIFLIAEGIPYCNHGFVKNYEIYNIDFH